MPGKIGATWLILLLTIGLPVCIHAQKEMGMLSFEQYGEIKWEVEQARLDNFAIQLTNNQELIGYILVFDEIGGCPGEARARAIRAKRYVVEFRGVPSNRVIWRREGFSDGISTILQPVPRNRLIPHQALGVVRVGRSGPLNKACATKLRRIKQSLFAS